jgi:hypothetical protein
MTPIEAAALLAIIVIALLALAAIDNAFRALRCAWSGHHWFIAYPSGVFGGRISECSRCSRRVVQR